MVMREDTNNPKSDRADISLHRLKGTRRLVQRLIVIYFITIILILILRLTIDLQHILRWGLAIFLTSALCGSSYLIARRGSLLLSVIIFLFSIYLTTSVVACLGSGLFAPIALLYLVTIFLAGLLVGHRGAIVMFLIVGITLVSIMVLIPIGRLPLSLDENYQFALLVMYAGIGALFLIMQRAANQEIDYAFGQLRVLHQNQEDLLHIVSHDLRIPITVIHGHMELLEAKLREHDLDSELELNTSTIDRNVKRMNVMIQDLADMARLEGHQFTLRLEQVTLQAFVNDLLFRLRDIFPMHRVIIDIPTDLPPVSADINRLERILLNILSNAFKYSAKDTPVCIRANQHDDKVIIAVIDQGRGIAPKELPHLFERFYRAKGERRAEGIGLGLYISKLLIEAHGGSIWVESELKKGSTFFFYMPMHRGDE